MRSVRFLKLYLIYNSVTLFTIMAYRNSPRGFTISNKVQCDSHQLSPVLSHFVPHPPDTPPPPDKSTTYESMLPTSTPTDITEFVQGVTIVVCNVEGDDTAVEDNTEDDSLM